MKHQRGYFISLNNRPFFIAQDSYYVKDMTIKRLLLSANQHCNSAMVQSVRSQLIRAELLSDIAGNVALRLKGGKGINVESITVIRE